MEPPIPASSGFYWTRIEGSISDAKMNLTNQRAQIVCVDGLNTVYRAEYDLATSDHRVEATIGTAVTRNFQGLIARAHSSALTYYLVFAHRTLNQLHFYKRVAGTYTLLTTVGRTFTDFIEDRLALEVIGSTINAYVNGTLAGTLVDTAITTGTRTGIFGNSTLLSANTGWIESFSAADALDPVSAVAATPRRTLFY